MELVFATVVSNFPEKEKNFKLHKTPLFYTAARLLHKPKTLIQQRCIKSCIIDKKQTRAKPLIDKDLALYITSYSWHYVN